MRKNQLQNVCLVVALCISIFMIPQTVENNKSNYLHGNNAPTSNLPSSAANSFNYTQVNTLWTELPGGSMDFIQINKDVDENADYLLIYGKMGAVCLDSSGVEKWRFKSNEPIIRAGYLNNSNQDAVFLIADSEETPNVIKLNLTTGEVIKSFGIEQNSDIKMNYVDIMKYVVPFEIIFVPSSSNLDIVYFLENCMMLIDPNSGEIREKIHYPFSFTNWWLIANPIARMAEDTKEIYSRFVYEEDEILKSAIYKLDLNDFSFIQVYITEGKITDFFVETMSTKIIYFTILNNNQYNVEIINLETEKTNKIVQSNNPVMIQQISRKKSNNFLTLELQESSNTLNVSLWKDSPGSPSTIEFEKSWQLNLNDASTALFNDVVLIIENNDYFRLMSQYCSNNHKEYYCEYQLSKTNSSVVQNELFLGYSLYSIENEAFGKGRIIPLDSNLTNIAILTIYGNFYTINHSNMSSKKIMGSPLSNFNQNDLLYMEINSELAIIAKKHAKFDNIVDYFVGMNKNDNKIYWKVALQNDSLGSFGFRDIRIIPDLTNDGYPEIVCYSQQLNSNEIEDKDLTGESTQIFLISGSNGTILENIFWKNIVDGSPISPFIDSINHFNESSVIIQPRIINSSVFLCNLDLLTKELYIKFTNYSTIGIQSPYSLKEQKVLAISQSGKNDFYMIGKNQNDTEIIRKINGFNWESNYSWAETWDPEGLYNIIETTWELEIPEEISLETFNRTKHPQEIAKISFVEYNLTNNYPELMLTNVQTEKIFSSIKTFIVDLLLGKVIYTYELQMHSLLENYQVFGNKLLSPIELFKQDFNNDGITDIVYWAKSGYAFNVSIISGRNGDTLYSCQYESSAKDPILYREQGVSAEIGFVPGNDSTILLYRISYIQNKYVCLVEETIAAGSSREEKQYILEPIVSRSARYEHIRVGLYENLNLDYYNNGNNITEKKQSYICAQIRENIYIFNYGKKSVECAIFTWPRSSSYSFGTIDSYEKFSLFYNNKLFITSNEGAIYSLDSVASKLLKISVVQEKNILTLSSIEGLQVHNLQFMKDGRMITRIVGGNVPYSITLPNNIDSVDLVIYVNGFGYIVNIQVEPVNITEQQIILIVAGIIVIAFIPFVIMARKRKYRQFLEEFEVNKR